MHMVNNNNKQQQFKYEMESGGRKHIPPHGLIHTSLSDMRQTLVIIRGQRMAVLGSHGVRLLNSKIEVLAQFN